MRKIFIYFMLLAVAFTACEKDPVSKPDKSISGVFILNQGTNKANNASLWVFSPESGETSVVISSIADNQLGDVAQDMLIYGGKLYIAITGSSVIRVLDVATKQDVKKIPFFNDTIPCQPRCLVAYDGKIYATCYNGKNGIVARIDTATLVWEKQTRVGVRPEGIAVNNGKLYVANSGPLYVYDNTVSVVDIATFSELRKITVGTNPNIVRADGNYIYLSYQGDWSGTPGGFQRIDVRNESIVTVSDSPTADFAIFNGSIYYYNVTYNADWTTKVSFGKMQVAANGSKTVSPLITGNISIIAPYGIAVHPETGDIYISDAGDYVNPGSVFVFDSQGKKINEFTVGIAPCKFVFY